MKNGKKIKSSKHITPTQTLSNSLTWANFVSDAAFMQFPEKDDWRKRLCFTLYEWANREKSLELMQFCMEYKISRGTLYEWRERYPDDIGKTVSDVLLILGSRRRIGTLERKYDRETAFRDMHTYDPEWIAINKYHADLKSQNSNNTTQPIHVTIEAVPSSPLVPIKKDNNEPQADPT